MALSALLTVGLVAFVGPAAFADGKPEAAAIATDATEIGDEKTERGAAEQPQDLTWMSGLWVFVDPETGEFRSRPTAEQAAWLRSRPGPNSSLNKSSEGLVPFKLDGGGNGVFLEGRFRHALVATVNGDGTLSVICSDSPDALDGRVPFETQGGELVSTTDEAPLR